MKILNELGHEIQSLKIEPDKIVKLTYSVDDTEILGHSLFAQKADFIMRKRTGESDSVARTNGYEALVEGRVKGRIVGDPWQDISGPENRLELDLLAPGARVELEIEVEGTEYDTGKVDLVLTCATYQVYMPTPDSMIFLAPSLHNAYVYTDVYTDYDGYVYAFGLQAMVLLQDSGFPLDTFEVVQYTTLLFEKDTFAWQFGSFHAVDGDILADGYAPSDRLLPRSFALDNSELMRPEPYTMSLMMDADAEFVYLCMNFLGVLTLEKAEDKSYTHSLILALPDDDDDDDEMGLFLRFDADNGKWVISLSEGAEEGTDISYSFNGNAGNIPLTGWMNAGTEEEGFPPFFPIDISQVEILEAEEEK